MAVVRDAFTLVRFLPSLTWTLNKGWILLFIIHAHTHTHTHTHRCSVLGLLPYSADALSVLFCYVPLEQPQTTPSPESSPGQEHAETVYHHAVAQLSIAELMSAVLCEGMESVDVGAVLTQVYSLGVFKAGQLVVSGTRRLAAVVCDVCIVCACVSVY